MDFWQGSEYPLPRVQANSVNSEPRATAAPEHVALLVLGVACIAHFWLSGLLVSEIALDIDPVNLMYGMREFNLAHFAPHPPGYLVYVWLLRGLHAVVGGPLLETVQLLARLFGVLTIPLVFEAVRRLRPDDARARSAAAVLTALNPFLLYHAVDAQTHTAEAFAAALLLLALIRYRSSPSLAWSVVLGLLLAFGSALRPSFVVAGVGPVVVVIGFRRFTHLCCAGVASILGAIGWLWPTAVASGGLDRWRLANDILVNQTFVRVSSPFSSGAIREVVQSNLAITSLWLLLLLLPVVLVLLARIGQHKASDDAYRFSRNMAWWSLGPAALFYLGAFCSEPGYLLGAMPPLVAWLAMAGGPGPLPVARRVYIAAALGEIIVLFLPPPVLFEGYLTKVPSVTDLIRRETVFREAVQRVRQAVPADARVLHVDDYADATLGRILPLYHERLHSMIVHSEYWGLFDYTAIGLATQDDCLPIPGDIWLQPGPPTIRDVPFSYDLIVISAFATEDLRNELRKHTQCNLNAPRSDDAVPLVLPASCFKDGTLSVHGQGIRFKLPTLQDRAQP